MSTVGRSSKKLTKGGPTMRLPSRAGASQMKRHASFDSPAEIPLPSPTPSSAGLSSSSIGQYPFPDVLRKGSHSQSSSTSSVDSLFSQKSKSTQSPPSSSEQSPPSSLPQTVPVNPRPYSVPDNMSPGSKVRPPMPHRSSTVKGVAAKDGNSASRAADRSSSASLPLPSHIPFSSLPRKQQPADRSIINRMTNATAVPLSSLPQRTSAPAAGPSRSTSIRRQLNKAQPPSSYHAESHQLPSHSATAGRSAIYRHADYPAPEPPQILDADDRPIGPVAPASDSSTSSTMSACSTASAPHVPFLSPLPAPDGTYIEVETRPGEYILHVRLPGFKRDAITLATKKRRILHVVADSWADTTSGSVSPSCSSCTNSSSNSNSSLPPSPGDHPLPPSRPPRPDEATPQHASDLRALSPNSAARGGHFERRISFGYDADLVQVRAEFDGEMLRVFIPRRASNVSFRSWV